MAYFEDDFGFQNAWNKYAGAQNADVEQQRIASLPDPRALAAQSLVQRYSPRAPSYSNVLGHYEINGVPADDQTEAGALHQFQHAKMRAAQDYLSRQSGDYAAGTAGRTMLSDPSFLQLPDPAKNAAYQQVYGNPLSEDLQADRLGGNMTIHDLRYRNDLPARQKGYGEYLKGYEGSHGFNPGDLQNPVQYDDKGNPIAGYDFKNQFLYSPAGVVQERDELGEPTGKFINKPATRHYVPHDEYQRVLQTLRNQAGLEGPARMPMPRPSIPGVPDWIGERVPDWMSGMGQGQQSTAAPMAPQMQPQPHPAAPQPFTPAGPVQGAGPQGHSMSYWDWRRNTPQGQQATGSFQQDPVRHQKLVGLKETLQRNGIQVSDDQLQGILERALESGVRVNGVRTSPIKDEHIIQVARGMQDEQKQHAAQVEAARRAYAQPDPTKTWGFPWDALGAP